MATAELELSEVTLPTSANREPEVNKLFRAVMKHEGSDLHLKAGMPPMMRHRNIVKPFGKAPLSNEDMERLMFPIISARLRTTLEETGGCAFPHPLAHPTAPFPFTFFNHRPQPHTLPPPPNN